MQYPDRGVTRIIFAVITAVMCSVAAFPAASQITEASVNVHLQVVNRCAMSLDSSANNARINVHCTRLVAYNVRIHPEASHTEQNGVNRVVVNY